MAKTKKKTKKNCESKKKGRKNIRKIMKNVDLSLVTKMAVKDEQNRKRRVKQQEKIVSY